MLEVVLVSSFGCASVRVDASLESSQTTGGPYNPPMSHKRYQFKLIEAADAADLEARLKEAGGQQWSAVGYGVLPDGRRSVLMERKVKVHTRRQRDDDRREAAVAYDK